MQRRGCPYRSRDRGWDMAEMPPSAAKGQLRRQLSLGHSEDRQAAVSEPSTWCTRWNVTSCSNEKSNTNMTFHVVHQASSQASPQTSGFISSRKRRGVLPCAWPLSGCSPQPSELTETLPASHYKLSHTPLNNKSQGLSLGCQPRWVGCVWLLMSVHALYTVETQERTRCITGWNTRNP